MEKKVVKLDAAIKYREEDLQNARILVDQFDNDDPDIEVLFMFYKIFIFFR